jgi:hypothetical protein
LYHGYTPPYFLHYEALRKLWLFNHRQLIRNKYRIRLLFNHGSQKYHA